MSDTTTVPGPAALSQTLRAYERLRGDLLSGYWPPGGKLAMNQLRARYETGASPLREALSRLVTEGLVLHNDQRGFMAAQASASELDDIVRTRIALESMALASAFARRTQEWEEALVLAFHRLSRTPRSNREDSYEENTRWEALHRAFHETLLSACQSPTLIGFCNQLYDRAYRYRQLATRASYLHRNELDEHREILDAVLSDRLADAQALLAEHYRRTAELFQESARH